MKPTIFVPRLSFKYKSRNFKLFNPSKNTALFQNESFKFTNITENELELIEQELINNNQLKETYNVFQIINRTNIRLST